MAVDCFCPACGHGLRFTTRMAWLRMLASLNADLHGKLEGADDKLHFTCLNCGAEFVMSADDTLATA